MQLSLEDVSIRCFVLIVHWYEIRTKAQSRCGYSKGRPHVVDDLGKLCCIVKR